MRRRFTGHQSKVQLKPKIVLKRATLGRLTDEAHMRSLTIGELISEKLERAHELARGSS